MKKKFIGIMLSLLVVMAMVLSGCASAPLTDVAKTSSSAGVASQGTGVLDIRVTDAPAKEIITSIMVAIKNLEIQKVGSGGKVENITEEEGVPEDTGSKDNSTWTVISNADGKFPPFDLLKVKDNPLTLSSTTPQVGSYKVRLEVESVKVTFGDNNTLVATVPSGKIKFNSTFDVTAGQATVLLLDFDAARSVNVTGNDKVMFKPVIKLTVSKENRGPRENQGNQGNKDNQTSQGKPAAQGNQGTSEKPGTQGNKGNQGNQGNRDSQEQGKNRELSIVTNKLPEGTVGIAYENTTLQANGGSSEYTWTIASGSLPAGLKLEKVNQKWQISGTPTAAVESQVTLKVTDSSTPPQSASKTFTIKIAAAKS